MYCEIAQSGERCADLKLRVYNWFWNDHLKDFSEVAPSLVILGNTPKSKVATKLYACPA